MADLYKGIAGSPITYLTADISADQTTISIADDSALPDAPNICTIGYGEHLETIKYETKSNGVLQNVTRGIEGTPRAWPAGTEVARFFTAYDHNAIIENFTSHLADYNRLLAEYVKWVRIDSLSAPVLFDKSATIDNPIIIPLQEQITISNIYAIEFRIQYADDRASQLAILAGPTASVSGIVLGVDHVGNIYTAVRFVDSLDKTKLKFHNLRGYPNNTYDCYISRVFKLKEGVR